MATDWALASCEAGLDVAQPISNSAPEIELAPAADASRPGYAKISVEEYLESL